MGRKTIHLCTGPVVELFRLLESLVSRCTVLHRHADSIERQPALKEASVNNRSVKFLIPDSKFGGDTARLGTRVPSTPPVTCQSPTKLCPNLTILTPPTFNRPNLLYRV